MPNRPKLERPLWRSVFSKAAAARRRTTLKDGAGVRLVIGGTPAQLTPIGKTV